MKFDSLFVGRDSEIRQLDALVGAVGRPGSAAVIIGEPGIGKTALLDRIARRSGRRVVSVRGVEGESILAHACAADLLTPLRRHFTAIAQTQQRALEVALTLADGSAGSPLAVYAGALGVLAAAGDEEPLVILIDDLQWVDVESRNLLLFAARRLELEQVAMIFAVRDEPGARTWLPHLLTIRLGGLTLDECGEMVRLRGIPSPPGVLRSVVRSTGGNPLAVIETLKERGADFSPRRPGDGLALGARLEHAWRSTFERLDERARRALFLLAVARWPGLPDLPQLLDAVGLSLADLVLAEKQNLVQLDGGTVQLRHPLLRQVVIDTTPLAHRLLTYRALAALAPTEQRAWYLSLATSEPDDRVAEELALAADAARSRGAYSSAALFLRRSAELTRSPVLRAGRLVQAADDSLLAGDATSAEAWSASSTTLHEDVTLAARATITRSIALTWMGDAAGAYQALTGLAEDLRAEEPALAAGLLCAAAMPARFLGDVHKALRAAEEGDALLDAAGVAPSFRELTMSAAARALAGQMPAARQRLAGAHELLRDLDRTREQEALLSLVLCHHWAEQSDIAGSMIHDAVNRARESGAPHALAFALNIRAEIDTRAGRWTTAYADAVEALRWAEELQQPSMIGFSLVTVARIEAGRGQRAAVEQRIARSRREVGPFHVDCQLVYEPAVLGLAALTVGEPDLAVEHLEDAWRRATEMGLSNPSIIPFVPDLAEAQIRCGQLDRAHDLVEWLLERADATGLGYPLVGAFRCRGLLADDASTADAAFSASAVVARRLGMPFELARTLLCQGEVLRRGRRGKAARSVLREAQRLFHGMGAGSWAEAAGRELTATGVRPVVQMSGSDDLAALTPQELQVARTIAAGRNNVEAAAALFVTPKTIEGHLTRIYRKLHIRSRSELVAVILAPGNGS